MTDAAADPLPEAITEEAAGWVAAAEGDALSSEQQRALDLWLTADPRHARAFSEMQDVWAHMGAVSETPALRASLPPVRTLRRRRATAGTRTHGRQPGWLGPAIAASLALVFIGVANDWPTSLRADAMTETGERKLVSLPDGSTVRLDTHSAVAFDFSNDRRVVRLLKGAAAFTVARDPDRPFTVEAGGGSATALGTRFLVRDEDDGARVTVTQHSVRVACPAPQRPTAVVAEGQSVAYDARGIGRLTQVNPDDAMAWADGVLTFKDAPLSHVVAEIGRYHRGYVQVLGDARSLRVSGVFRIDDPVASLDQLQRSLGLHSTRLTDRLIFISN